MNQQLSRLRLLISHGSNKKGQYVSLSRWRMLSPDLQPSSPPAFCFTDGAAPPQKQFFQLGKYIIYQASSSEQICTAVDRATGQEYVCKILPLGQYKQAVAPYLATDGHPHVISIWEIILGQSCAYIFFLRGHGDLHSYIRERKKIDYAEARDLARQVVEAVCHCHQRGVVLRDLKLRKFIFRDSDKTELFLDGLDDAVVLDDPDASDTLTERRACRAYASPEIRSSSGAYSGKCADRWSLGVLVYTILVGRYPFHGLHPVILFQDIRRAFYRVPESVPTRARCLLHNLLRYFPSERLSAAEALDHPWFTRPILTEPPDHSNFFAKKVVDQIVPDEPVKHRC